MDREVASSSAPIRLCAAGRHPPAARREEAEEIKEQYFIKASTYSVSKKKSQFSSLYILAIDIINGETCNMTAETGEHKSEL
jgi:hypothetical protein